MSNGVNKVILIGNLGADVEVRYSQSGAAVANLRVAVNERVKKGDDWEDETFWTNVVVFGRTAENCGQYLSKGRQIYVEGRLRNTEWTDKEGNTRRDTEVVAFRVSFLGGEGARGDGPKGKPKGKKKSEPAPGGDDDELPF